MRTVFISIIVAILVSAPLAQGQIHSPKELRLRQAPAQKSKGYFNQELGIKPGEKDFLLPGEGFATGPPIRVKGSTSKYVSTVVSSAFPVESVVQYKSFTFGTTSTLFAFSGKYVSYLIPQNLIGAGGLSKDEIRELVDLTDVLYAHMVEVVGGEPGGDGLLTIALLNPGYDFGGRGWVGTKGLELYPGYVINYKKDLLAGCVPNGVVHEMAHNFDLYNDYISHDGNNYHAWTAFLIPYSQYYMQTGAARQGQVVAPTALLNQTISGYMNTWDAAGESASWEECVKTGSNCEAREIYSNEIWAGVVLRFARLHGPSEVRRAFRFVGEYKNSHPTAPVTAEEKNDVLVSAFAAGAGSNIQCELDVWRWPISLASANQMNLDFPGQNSLCRDTDNDGRTPTQGDRDDFNAAIHPGATDTSNGIDDDCNGIIDDTLLQEIEDFPGDANSAALVTIPGHVIGRTATATDSDSYRIEITTVRSINIWAKGIDGNFNGWFELRYAADPGGTKPIYVNASNSTGTVVPFDRAGTWILAVMAWPGGGQGYELFFNEIHRRQLPQLRIVNYKANLILANVGTDENLLHASAPTDVRLWAEGVGFIAQQIFQPVTIFKWSKLPGANLRLRAQFLTGDSPRSGTTRSVAVDAVNTNGIVNPIQGVKPKIELRPTSGGRTISNSTQQEKSRGALLHSERFRPRPRGGKQSIEQF